MTKKKPPVTRSQEQIAIDKIVRAVTQEDFDSLCEKGQKLVRSLVEASTVKKKFTHEFTFRLYANSDWSNWFSVQTESPVERLDDFDFTVVLKHKKTGEKIEIEPYVANT